MTFRFTALLIALLAALSGVACDDPEVPTGPSAIPPFLPGGPDPDLQTGPDLVIVRPGTTEPLPDGEVLVRFDFEDSGPESIARDFWPRPYFRHRADAPGRFEPLDFSVEADNPGVVLAVLVDDRVLMDPLNVGQSLVRVSASDESGDTASFSVAVTVTTRNFPPSIAVPLPTFISMDEHEVRARILSLDDHFEDPDGDSLQFSVTTSDDGVVRPYITGSYLSLVAVHAGTTGVQVRAEDPSGEFVSHRIRILVRPTGH